MPSVIVLLSFALVSSGVTAGYPDGSTGNTVTTGDGTSNSFGYGYSGSFAGGSPGDIPSPVFDFQRFLMNYLESINKYHQEFIKKGGGVFSYSHASSSPYGNAVASSSLTFKGQNRLQSIASQAGPAGTAGAGAGSAVPASGGSTAFGGGSGFGGGYGGSFADSSGVGEGYGASVPNVAGGAASGSSGSAPNLFSRFGDQGGAAFASGSVGPDGVQQTAAVYPENPGSPNVNTRFGGSGQPGGFKSVFTSSQSSTTTVDGKPHTVQQASTTVNDNGKITTYTAKNP